MAPPVAGHAGRSVSLSSAYTATIDARSAHMTLTSKVTVASKTVSIAGEGAFDWAHRLGQFTASVQVPGGGQDLSFTEILDGTSLYLQLPQAAQASGGKPWTKVDISQFGQSGSADPSQTLAVLESQSSGLQDLGPATIGGVATTHYRATVDISKAASSAAPAIKQLLGALSGKVSLTSFPLDVWVDGQGLPRQMSFTFTVKPKVPTSDGTSATTGTVSDTTTMDLSDFGTPVSVTPPPADQVSTQSLQGLLPGS